MFGASVSFKGVRREGTDSTGVSANLVHISVVTVIIIVICGLKLSFVHMAMYPTWSTPAYLLHYASFLVPSSQTHVHFCQDRHS